MPSIVALDFETTGLDPERDAIIEIGAVKFSGSRVEAEFSSLVNPGRHVPPFVTGLTGIDDAMVRQAPAFTEIAGDVLAFTLCERMFSLVKDVLNLHGIYVNPKMASVDRFMEIHGDWEKSSAVRSDRTT